MESQDHVESATPALGPGHANTPVHGRALGLLGLTALGVVYGDIGTSPLYALRECFHGDRAAGGHPTPTSSACCR